MTTRIQVTNLRELRTRLRTIDRQLPRRLRVALNKAADIVADEARSNVPVRTGKSRRSVRSVSTQRSARVKAGGARVPWFPWLDYGGRVGPNDSVYREHKREGRYVYPAYYQSSRAGEIRETLQRELEAVARSAGL